MDQNTVLYEEVFSHLISRTCSRIGDMDVVVYALFNDLTPVSEMR